MRMRIWDYFDPGSGMEKIGCEINIPDPQHWVQHKWWRIYFSLICNVQKQDNKKFHADVVNCSFWP
jgi:hypothetical protein